LRWALPAAFLVAEYLFLSILVDFPTSGPAMGIVAAVRLLVPVLLGAGAAGWLLARRAPVAVAGPAPLPAWRPLRPLALHLAAFALTAVLAFRLLRGGAGELRPGPLLLWLGCVLATVLLAFSSAAPLSLVLGRLFALWRIPLVAIALGLLAWRSAAAAESLWGGLSGGTLQAVAWLLHRFTSDVTFDPARDLIGAGDFSVLVAPVCSGADGIGLVVLFEAVWISLARRRLRFPRALLLLPLGALAAVLANVVRITVLVLVGAAGLDELAWSSLHSKLGWILFVGIALGSVGVAERTPWLKAREESAGDEGVPPAAVAYLTPLLAALAAALVTSVFAPGPLDPLYGARIAAALAALALVRKSLPRPSFSFSAVPIALAAAVCAFWIPFTRGGGEGLAAALAGLDPLGRASWIAVRVLGSVLVIPVAEELAFRGFLLPWLVSPDLGSVSPRSWTWPAVLLSSLAFGAVHQQWILGTLAGLAFAAARLYRGRLSDAILAHAAANAGIAAAVLAGGRYQLWG